MERAHSDTRSGRQTDFVPADSSRAHGQGHFAQFDVAANHVVGLSLPDPFGIGFQTERLQRKSVVLQSHGAVERQYGCRKRENSVYTNQKCGLMTIA